MAPAIATWWAWGACWGRSACEGHRAQLCGALSAHHLGHAGLDLLGRHILDVRGDGPVVAEGILHRTAAIAVELRGDRAADLGAGVDGALELGVDVVEVKVVAGRRPAQAGRAARDGVGHL